MSKPLCRLCPKAAHFNFREGILLCAECAADILKLCEISAPSAPAFSDASASAPTIANHAATSAAGASSIEEPQRQADQQSQYQAKHEASIDAGVVVSHRTTAFTEISTATTGDPRREYAA